MSSQRRWSGRDLKGDNNYSSHAGVMGVTVVMTVMVVVAETAGVTGSDMWNEDKII